MFRFEEPIYLYLLLLLPLLAVLYFYSNYRRRKAIKKFGDPELMAQLMPDVSKYRPDVKFWILFAAIGLFAVLLARPQFGSRLETVKRQGIEVIIALDISNSMLAEDVQPSRLEKAKRLVTQLVDKMENDKVGMIVFAGDAFTQLPITSDYISAKMFLETIDPSLISKQGTAIGAAINLSARSFTPQEGVGRTIILITDGENHEDGALEAAKAATDKGIQINVLGVGMPEGAPIPIPGSNDYRRDREGNVVVTKLNEQMCQEIAQAGKGIYVRVDNTNAAQKAITQEVNKLAKADVETQVYTEFNEQFQAIAWIILILLLVEMLILDKKNPLFKNISLFSNKKFMVTLLLSLITVGASAQKAERDYIRKGNRQFADSAFVDAEVNYRKALDVNPKSAISMYNLGNTLLAQNKAQEAMEQYVAASKLEKNKGNLAQIYHNMGVIFHGTKDFAKAVEAYKESLRNNPNDDETRYNLALAQKQLNEQQQQQQNQDQQQQEQKEQEQQEQQQQQQEQEQQQNQNQQQQNKEEMSKENAEQLLRSVMQDEKDTQEKLKKQQVIQGGQLQKDW